MGQVPYHGPHVVLDLQEARAIKQLHDGVPYDRNHVDSAIEKIHWALEKSHPKFLEPAP